MLATLHEMLEEVELAQIHDGEGWELVGSVT